RRCVALGGMLALVLIAAVLAASVAGASTPRKKKVVPPPVSNTIHVVVPRGQPIQIAFAADSGFDGTASLADAIQMAVDNHGGVLGFPIRIDAVNAPTCGIPPNAVSAATSAAYKITANLRTWPCWARSAHSGSRRRFPSTRRPEWWWSVEV